MPHTFRHAIHGVVIEYDEKPMPGPFPANLIVKTDSGDWTLSALDLPVDREAFLRSVGKKIRVEWKVVIE